MKCICQVFGFMLNKGEVPEPAPRYPDDVSQSAGPGPQAHSDGRGPAPGSRHPILSDSDVRFRPGDISAAVRMFERPVTETDKSIGPTDVHNPFPRTAAEGGRIRAVDMEYVLVGGPACTAPLSDGWGWVHNYGYITIADTLKPAQQYPHYTLASVDTDTLLDRARASVLRALYGG